MQAISRIERSWSQRTRVVPVVIVIVFAAFTAGCGSKSTPTSTAAPASTTTPVTTTAAKKAVVVKPIKPIPASAAPRAKAYIAAHGADVKLVAGYEHNIQVAIAEVVNSPLMTPLQQATEQTGYKISKVLPRFKGPYTQDALGQNEKQISTQAHAIEGTMKILLNYTNFPTPVTLGEYADTYQKVVLAWNKAVKAIWTVAHVAKPPTICTTC
jgi:uncharacterized lipoprotein YmbA